MDHATLVITQITTTVLTGPRRHDTSDVSARLSKDAFNHVKPRDLRLKASSQTIFCLAKVIHVGVYTQYTNPISMHMTAVE